MYNDRQLELRNQWKSNLTHLKSLTSQRYFLIFASFLPSVQNCFRSYKCEVSFIPLIFLTDEDDIGNNLFPFYDIEDREFK